MKRRGNRRYYQHHEVLMIRRIRELLYDQGFTISGARLRLQELAPPGAQHDTTARAADADAVAVYLNAPPGGKAAPAPTPPPQEQPWRDQTRTLRRELRAIRDLLTPAAS